MTSDAVLLNRWRAGDASAGNELFCRHFGSVHRFFEGKCDSIDDLVQNTFLKCAESAERLKKAASFRAYLLSIARNELLQEYRRRGRRPQSSREIEQSALIDLMPSPSLVVADREEHRLLLRGLQRIPLESQLALELHYWEGLTTAELADVLGLPHGTAKGRLQRARAQLREAVEALEASPELLQSTMNGLETWAARMQEQTAARSDPDRE